ncbi:MAG: imidazole glycerol phosphate synthase subunit HisH [Flavobacteriaceae bacterium]|nr:imidazole glycerol phosphate synthase subunit HisH [Flavobacteriaceae bacterium]
MISVGIVDYGVGNIHSLSKSLRIAGFRPEISSSKELLSKSDIILLPGVGSFSFAIDNLKKSGLDSFIIKQSKINKPIIGICLGMQLLCSNSTEGGINKGLGIIPGKIKRMSNSKFHIGWNSIQLKNKNHFLKRFNNHEFFFNHGYQFAGNQKYVIAETEFEKSFPTIIKKNNTIGFQFHPEKSQKAGIQLLKKTIKSISNIE